MTSAEASQRSIFIKNHEYNFAHFFFSFKHPVRHEILKYGCMSASTDKLRPLSLRSGLSALGSGGRRFEEGSHLCFMYILKKKKRKKKNWYGMKEFK